MSTLPPVSPLKIAPLRIIEDYSDTPSNINLVCTDIEEHLNSDAPNEENLHILFQTLKWNLEKHKVECPKDLKERISKLPMDKETSRHAFAVAYRWEVKYSIQFMHEHIREPNPHILQNKRHVQELIGNLAKGCLAHRYLESSQWNLLRDFVSDLQFREWMFRSRNHHIKDAVFVFDQIKAALNPILKTPLEPLFQIPHLIVPPLTDVEEMSSAESWDFIRPPTPTPVASTSSAPNDTPMNPIKKTLVDYIEGVLANVLKYYGETFLQLLTLPLDDVFKGEKIGLIIDEALSNTATPFTKEDKEAWKNFLCQSVPTLAREFLSKTTDTINDPGNGYQFIHGITRLISPMCFKAPESDNDHHKTLLLSVLSQVNMFLRDYQTASVSIKPLPGSTEEAVERDILCAMIQTLQSRTSKTIFRNEQDPQIFAADISDYIAYTIEAHMQANEIKLPSPLNECVKAVVNHYVYSILNIVFSPFIIALGIHRLVDNLEEVEHPKEGSSIPLPQPTRDDQFSTALAIQFWNMITPILHMGGNPKLITWIIKTFKSPLQKYLMEKSKEIDKELQNIMNSDCVLMPFILLDKILFNHRDGKIIPAIRGLISSSAGTREAFTRSTINNFRGRPYEILSKIIKKETSSFTLMMAETFGDIDTFFPALFNRLIKLAEQERIIKLLIIYLCNAYLDYLSQRGSSQSP
jgi:hypothetical protein